MGLGTAQGVARGCGEKSRPEPGCGGRWAPSCVWADGGRGSQRTEQVLWPQGLPGGPSQCSPSVASLSPQAACAGKTPASHVAWGSHMCFPRPLALVLTWGGPGAPAEVRLGCRFRLCVLPLGRNGVSKGLGRGPTRRPAGWARVCHVNRGQVLFKFWCGLVCPTRAGSPSGRISEVVG